MGIVGNRYLQGQPILPYASVKSYTDTDVFIDLVFVDHTQTQVTPVSIQMEIDDLTNSVTLIGPTTLTPTGSAVSPLFYLAFAPAMTLQIAGVALQMTYPYEGSQICQVKMTFTAIDSVTGNTFTSTAPIAMIELCAVSTVSGQ
jgi:hypothetical protein